MQTFDQRGQWQGVKQVSDQSPHARRAVNAYTLVVETVHLTGGDGDGWMGFMLVFEMVSPTLFGDFRGCPAGGVCGPGTAPVRPMCMFER